MMQDCVVRNYAPCKALILTQLTVWCVCGPRSPKEAESVSFPTLLRLANSCGHTWHIGEPLRSHEVRCFSRSRQGILHSPLPCGPGRKWYANSHSRRISLNSQHIPSDIFASRT